ncbi:sugar transporter [Marinomonas sp. M1K-6]|uniref:Sugar transporter n=1 Tax=Marinomonas profundi TaxID=2726122 RepID=A0A847RAM7_9GAMM|nr:SLBB domain-containing protein [Marinomonas profundi]NLQ19076.1 sugar transporter [Marinomonas profundi]UDV04221.1 SLBB domain-containing protein [Marinomonas profundi]
MRLDKRLIATLMMILAGNAVAFTPSAAQINQLKNLPKAQQEALARQYGVDLDSMMGGGTSASPVQQAPVLAPISNSAPQPQTDNNTAKENSTTKTPLFGYDVLNGGDMGFTVVDDLPVPLDYQVGPGDVINLQMFGKSSQNASLTIDRDGTINLPELGPLAVSGQNFEQLRQQIINVIKQKVIGVDVSVTMGAMRTMQVYIVGEATQPGAYNVNGLTTITQALLASGGVKQSGSLRHIQLKRKGKVVTEFDLYDLLINGDTSKDVRLSSGDTLFIPMRNNRITIEGQVARPATYELKDDASLNTLLATAGGAKPQAFLSKVNVRRTNAKGVQQITLDLSTAAGRRFTLEDGDEIRLDSVASSLKNAIAVRGEVARQGALSFTPGMRVRDAIGSIDNGLKQSADVNYALLVREINQNQHIEVYQFSLLEALTNPTSLDNLVLQEKDQIFVFDNGLAQGYWFGSYANSKAKGEQGGTSKEREVLDAQTGAIVVQAEATELDVAGINQVSNAAELRKASRESLLEPILDRLKEQASFSRPAQLIEISGAVKFPGTYPLVKNVKVSSLLAAAGGLAENAYLNSAELSRRVATSGDPALDRVNFSLNDAISGKYPIQLGPMDHLIIKTQPGWQEGMIVELQGEFIFPGRYTFQRGETLKDVIERAGGFTEFAYPDGAVLSRERLKRQEAERLKYINAQLKQEISNMSLRRQGSTSSTDPAQAIAIVDQLDQAEPVGRLVIDLNRAMAGNQQANLMLEKGDKLFVPALNPVVSIVGEVQFTSHHTFDPALTVDDYILSAGGTKRQADTDRVYIVKANGSVEMPNNSFWFSRQYDPLAPGDTVIVPINTDYLDGLSTLSTATQILYQIGVAWSAIKD